MTPDRIQEIMRERGYVLNNSNPDKTHMGFSKEFELFTIHADTSTDDNGYTVVKLTVLITMLHYIVTGEFSIDHPQFKLLYEHKLVLMAEACSQFIK